jgi:hypothetical protein
MGMRFRMDKCWYLVVWKIVLEFWGGYTAMVGIEMVGLEVCPPLCCEG